MSLADREQRERDAVHEHRHDEEMPPRRRVARQTRSGEGEHDQEGCAADGQTDERDLNGREHLEPELDPPERTTPDRPEQHERGLPRKAWHAGARPVSLVHGRAPAVDYRTTHTVPGIILSLFLSRALPSKQKAGSRAIGLRLSCRHERI